MSREVTAGDLEALLEDSKFTRLEFKVFDLRHELLLDKVVKAARGTFEIECDITDEKTKPRMRRLLL